MILTVKSRMVIKLIYFTLMIYLIFKLENENYLDDTIGELENSIYNLTMAALEVFFTRFLKTCVSLVNNLVANLLQSKPNLTLS